MIVLGNLKDVRKKEKEREASLNTQNVAMCAMQIIMGR
jgi:hypothetical protein